MPWCMYNDISFCTCPPHEHIIFSPDATFYPKSRLLRVGNQLFIMRSEFIGRHAISTLVHALNSSFSYMLVGGVYNRIYIGFQYSMTRKINGMVVNIPSRFTCGLEYLHHGVVLTVHVRRVQRAIRSFLRRKWEERAVAVMMASHKRLGLGSALGSLHSDVLPSVCAMMMIQK